MFILKLILIYIFILMSMNTIIFSDPLESTQTIDAQIYNKLGVSSSINFSNIENCDFEKISTKKIKFKNCIGLCVQLSPNNIKNIKLFSNGILQIPGIKNENEIPMIFDILKSELSKCEPNTFPIKFNFAIKNICMKMIHIKILHPRVIRLDQEKIFDHIKNLNDTSINVSFENIKTKQLNMSKRWKTDQGESRKIIYYIFSTGCINMTLNHNNIKYTKKSYDFIVKFFTDNIDKFILKDRTYHILNVLKIPIIKQRTRDWHVARKTSITSSDIKYIIDKKYRQYRSNFISRKIMNIMHNIYKFTENTATRHGIIFEPIAVNVYLKKLNSLYKYSLIYKECGFYTKKYKKIILGSSPDGIIIKINKFIKKKKPKKYIVGEGKKFTKLVDSEYSKILPNINKTITNLWDLNQSKSQIPTISFSTNELEFLRYREEFIDGYLIEIKCPYSNFTLFDLSKPPNLKLMNPGYYSQVQCQMFTTGINMTILFAVKFKTYKTYTEFKRKTTKKDIRGMYANIYTTQNKYITHYPKKIFTLSLKKFKSELHKQIKNNERIEYCFWKVENCRAFEVLFDVNWISIHYRKLKKYYKKIFVETEKTYLEMSPSE